MVSVGQQKQVVKFEKLTTSLTETGRTQEEYVEFLTTWGHLKKKSGHRGYEANQSTLEGKWELTVRFQTALENEVWKSMRVIINNRVFTFVNMELVNEVQKKYYVFDLNERTNG